MEHIKEALTFDDVLLVPRYSSVLPAETNLSINLSQNLNLKIPFLSSAMETVTESNMAIAIAQKGGLGIIHRNLSISEQAKEINKVKKKKLNVGAAVGTSNDDLIRTKSLLDAGVDLIVIDTAHGHSEKVVKILKFVDFHQVRYLTVWYDTVWCGTVYCMVPYSTVHPYIYIYIYIYMCIIYVYVYIYIYIYIQDFKARSASPSNLGPYTNSLHSGFVSEDCFSRVQ